MKNNKYKGKKILFSKGHIPTDTNLVLEPPNKSKKRMKTK